MSNGGIIGKENRPNSTAATGVWDVNELYHARIGKNWPGSLEVHVGDFTVPASTGTQTVTFGSGKTWTPKAIIFFASGSTTTSGTWFGQVYSTLGFTAGTTNSYSVGGYSQDAVAANTARAMESKALIWPLTAGNGYTAAADLSSFDAGGFTLNWTTNGGDRFVVGYIAFGGDIQAKAVQWTFPSTAINKAVTGVGFQPDLVFHAQALRTANGPSTDHYFGFGAMNSSGEQWAVSTVALDTAGASNTSRWQRTDSAFMGVQATEGQNFRATYVSMDVDGFTTNFATASGSLHQGVSLCLRGVVSKLGSFNKPTTAAPVTQSVNSPGFLPTATLFANYLQTPGVNPTTYGFFGIGAHDGINHRSVVQFDNDGANPARAQSLWYNDKTIVAGVSTGGPTASDVGVVAHTATGFDMTWNPGSTGYGPEVLYAAITGKGGSA